MPFHIQISHLLDSSFIRIGLQSPLPEYRSLAVMHHGEHGKDKPTKEFSVDSVLSVVKHKFTLSARDEFIVARHRLAPGDHVYGLGEKTGWLDKRPRRYTMRNADVWMEHPGGIGNTTDPLYASFPIFIVHNAKGSYGIFVDNPEFTEFDFTADDAYEFAAPADALNFYILPGPTLPDVLRQYTGLTGRMPLPALWTLGYHQCRWGYASEADIRRVAAELRARRIPADAMWFDIDYMRGFRVFTWDDKKFPRPARLIADLAADGLRAVTIVDPGVKVDPGYDVYTEGRAGDHFIKHSDGREYNGSVWPGRSTFPDFHHPAARQWWAGRVHRWLGDHGIGGLWIDMNEPAATDLTGPIADARHDGGALPHAAARNTYGLQMARATFDGMLAHNPDSRPFILTRAAYSGAQTVTALWGGDNSAQWEHLAASLPLLMNLGLSGMPFVGVDIGGFGGDTHGELLARWTQAGVFYPFCRNHALTGTNAHEPWAFGPQIEAVCRRYIGLRYQLLPYFYNLFHQASQTGAPIMRPLVWHYPHDPRTFNLNDQFLLGPDLLVAPVLAPGLTARAVYLPKGRWYRWRPTGTLSATQPAVEGPTHIIADAPLHELPLFVRAGAIIPMWPLAQHTAAIHRADVRLHLWPGNGQLDFYEDDGETRAYQRGEYRATGWRLTLQGNRLRLATRPSGGPPASPSPVTLVFHHLPGGPITLDAAPIPHRRRRDVTVVKLFTDGNRHIVELSATSG